MIYITNFNSSRHLSDIKDLYDKYKATNINFLIDDFESGKTIWSVPRNAHPGDVAIFMCAKEARHNLGMATSSIPDDYSDDFRAFVIKQKELYKKYSGFIIGYGMVASKPEDKDGWIRSDIDNLVRFEHPIYIDEFREFISISRTNSFTFINDEQWGRLKWVINQVNPNVFADIIIPDINVLEDEFEEAVKKAYTKSEDVLRKEAERNSSQSKSNTVKTKVYYRDPIIAAYVKKRAKGHCQLCGNKAPFDDKNGYPYLECHHIDWLSNGGVDSIENCVALCPNCHRKMHVINDPNDICKLKCSCKV